MTKNKKYLLLLVIAVLAVVVVGTGTVTYAWFLSLQSAQYEFELNSVDDHVILQYETEVAFASGNVDTSSNKLLPATAKSSGAGLISANAQITYDEPLDMFRTTKVESVARAVRFAATGAYWVGASTTSRDLIFEVSANVSGDDFDLVAAGEISYVAILHYNNDKFMYYNGKCYLNVSEVSADLTLPTGIVGSDTERYWRELTAEDTTMTTDGTKMLLPPNSEFSYDLYLFIAQTEELMEPEMNGKTLALTVTIGVEE